MCEPSQRLEISEDEKDELGKKLLLHETEFRNVAAGQRKQAETMAKLREVCQPLVKLSTPLPSSCILNRIPSFDLIGIQNVQVILI